MPSMSPAARALLDHPAECCRWPIGDGWCQRRAVRGAYCAAHHRQSIDPVQHDYSPLIVARMLREMSARLGRGRFAKFRRAA